jgi:hypothetical protein
MVSGFGVGVGVAVAVAVEVAVGGVMAVGKDVAIRAGGAAVVFCTILAAGAGSELLQAVTIANRKAANAR